MSSKPTSSTSSTSPQPAYAQGSARSLLQRANSLLKRIEEMRHEVESWKTTLGMWLQACGENAIESFGGKLAEDDMDAGMKAAEEKVHEASKATSYEKLAGLQPPAPPSKGNVGPTGQKGPSK